MKKILSMAAIALFMSMTSCSGDDSSETTNPSTETVLLKKIITTDEDGNAVTTNYTYDGTKLVKVTDSQGLVSNHYYEGDLPVKVEYFENNVLTQRDVFTYANGNLSSMTILDLDEDWG